LCIEGSDLTCYTRKGGKLIFLHSLTTSYIDSSESDILKYGATEKVFSKLIIRLSQRAKRVLFFESEIERNIWKITLREILQLDQKGLKNQYNLGSVLIGQGSFGKVFKGVCK
jgi:hypothetical protein